MCRCVVAVGFAPDDQHLAVVTGMCGLLIVHLKFQHIYLVSKRFCVSWYPLVCESATVRWSCEY